MDNRTVEIYKAKYVPEIRTEKSWKSARVEKGEILFEGTIQEAKVKFCGE